MVKFQAGYSPGNSPAQVSFTNVELGGFGTTTMEIGGPGTTDSDQINATGLLTFGGALEIDFINGYTGRAGDTFDLFNWGTKTGAFSSIALPSLVGGLGWDTSALYTTGEVSIIPVPKPAAALGLAAAGLGAVGWVRRGRQAGRRAAPPALG